MDHLKRLGSSVSVPFQSDEEGFTGRECPDTDCEGYFKVEFGTGLQGKNLPCHCPYCGHVGGHNEFWTKDQLEYAKSIAIREVTNAVRKDLKKLEFDHKPKGAFGIGFSLKLKNGRPTPIHYYREKQLETEVVCDNCTLHYSVYGVFAFCPDCGKHNSLQILDKNLELVGKMLDLAAGAGREVAEKLVENALEDCVSAFDGFGREICRLHANRATNPSKAKKMSFQNLEAAKTSVVAFFGHDLSAHATNDEWQLAMKGFQKRHVVAHRMGVTDQEYVNKTNDPDAVIGRKIAIAEEDVRSTVAVVQKIACGLFSDLAPEGSGPDKPA